MSSSLVIQTKDEIFIGADSAISTNINDEIFRVDGVVKKVFEVENFVIFLSGELEFCYSVMNDFLDEKVKSVNSFLTILKNNYKNEKIDSIICEYKKEGSLIYQISPYNNFEILKYPNLKDGEVNVITAGIKTEYSYNCAVENILNGHSVREIYSNVFDEISYEGIGGKLNVFRINKDGISNFINKDIKEKKNIKKLDVNSLKNIIKKHMIVGERIYGKIIMGVNLAIEDESGILIIQGSRGRIYNRDGVLRMHFGLVEENGVCGEAFGLISENEITQVKVTDCEGFVINRKNPSEQDYPNGWEKVFWTTPDGTIFAHDLVVSNIKVVQNKEWNKLIMDSELGFFDLGFFSKIVKDGKLTTDEKLQLITEMMQISSSYMSIIKQAEKYMYVARDDEIDFTQAFNTYAKDFPRQESTEAKMNLQPLRNAYLELVNFMSQYIKITSSHPHEPLQIKVEDEMTETTSDLGENREKLIVLFKKYYDEYDKLSDNIEDVIVYQGISMGNNYNNTFIGEHGVVVVRNDGMYRAYLNATNGLALEKWENGVWVKKLYGALNDPMWEDGTLIAEGLVTKNLRIVDANMNDRITFDWYDGITIYGDSNIIYLNANDSIKITDLGGDAKFWVDMDGYLYAKDITTHNLSIVDGNLGEKIIFDHDDGITINGNNGEQIRLNANEGIAIDVNGEKRVWIGNDGLMYAKKLYIMGEDSDEILEDIDGSYISDLTVNSLKTLGYEDTKQDIIHIAKNFFRFNTWYSSDEKTKLEFTFEGTGDNSYPVMILGSGNGNAYGSGSEQGKIYKDMKKFAIEYDAPNGKMTKFLFNETDSDDEGQAVYFESKGGVRFHSDNKFVAKTNTEEFMRVVRGEDVRLQFGNRIIELKNEHVLLKFDDSNYIKIDSTGVTVKGAKINLN